ncbi:TraU family protein [Vibrio lentus]|uniref:TraU family protein n=1 Tax=Vibrio lentus TaxID=136468 RepID=UPI0039A6032B
MGLNIGYWEPYALTDVTRVPYCMVNMGMQHGLGVNQPKNAVVGTTARDSGSVMAGFITPLLVQLPPHLLAAIDAIGGVHGHR